MLYTVDMTLSIGSVAPNFSLEDSNGVVHSLSEYSGKWLLLYFYPKDDTPGCTKEACQFRDSFSELDKAVKVVGVSSDSVESHKRFAEKYHLPFTLLADTDREVIHAYQVDGTFFPKRTSFLINPAGKIAKIYDKVNVHSHADQILKDVQRVQQTA